MQSKSRDLTIVEDLKAKLLGIAEDVTTKDRTAYMEISGHTRSTVSAYLNGKINDTDTGLYMFLFFKNRIAEKKKILSAV